MSTAKKMQDYQLTVSRNIKSLLKKHGWTQKELAERLNTAPETVSRWTSGNVMPSWGHFFLLCVLFKCSPNDLFSEKTQSEASRISDLVEKFRQILVNS